MTAAIVIVSLTGNLDPRAVEDLHPQIQELVRAGYRRFVLRSIRPGSPRQSRRCDSSSRLTKQVKGEGGGRPLRSLGSNRHSSIETDERGSGSESRTRPAIWRWPRSAARTFASLRWASHWSGPSLPDLLPGGGDDRVGREAEVLQHVLDRGRRAERPHPDDRAGRPGVPLPAERRAGLDADARRHAPAEAPSRDTPSAASRTAPSTAGSPRGP